MKVKYLLSALCATLLLSGCNDTDVNEKAVESDNTQKSVELRGSSTLAQALICLDENSDYQCSTGEISTRSQEDGSYTLELAASPQDGTNLIATEGINLILLEESPEGHALLSPYHEGEMEVNINTLTTLVSLAMRDGESYEEAITHVASRYNLEEKLISKHPLDSVNKEETQIHFQTIFAMEEYQLHVLKEKASLLRSGGWDLDYISFDEADASMSYFDVLLVNVKKFILNSALFLSYVSTPVLEYLGIIDYSRYDMRYSAYHEVDEANLHPTLTKVYHNEVSTVTVQERDAFIETIKTAEDKHKNYTDMIAIFNASSSDESAIFLTNILAEIEDGYAISALIMMMRLDEGKSDLVYSEINKIIDSLAYDNETGEIHGDAGMSLRSYFNDNYDDVYSQTICTTIFKMGEDTPISYILRMFEQHFNEEITLTQEVLLTIDYIDSIAGSRAVINMYNNTQNSEYKFLLRQVLANIANDKAVSGLYEIAATIEDESDFTNIVQLFEKVKTLNPNAKFIVLERPTDGDVVFKVEALRTQIEEVFRDQP